MIDGDELIYGPGSECNAVNITNVDLPLDDTSATTIMQLISRIVAAARPEQPVGPLPAVVLQEVRWTGCTFRNCEE